MIKKFSDVVGLVVSLYGLSVLILIPYFNWQYAKENGFLKWLILGEIVPTAQSVIWPYYILFNESDPPIDETKNQTLANTVLEFTDNDYNYAFQYPSDWRMKKTPDKGEFGEVRVLLQGSRDVTATVTVERLGTTISKEQFDANPNSLSIVQKMIDFTFEKVYKKTSRDLKTKSMTVVTRRNIPSPVAMKFYISTLHMSEKGSPLAIAGLHYVPFGKPYGIVLMMVSPTDPKSKAQNETFGHVFNSFHIIGEPPSIERGANR